MTETFAIEAFSGPDGQALWCEHWHCNTCGSDLTPENCAFDTHCPLHNPMRCSGNGTHTITMCYPISGTPVFTLDLTDDFKSHMERRAYVGVVA